jgi:hypothetical protein
MAPEARYARRRAIAAAARGWTPALAVGLRGQVEVGIGGGELACHNPAMFAAAPAAKVSGACWPRLPSCETRALETRCADHRTRRVGGRFYNRGRLLISQRAGQHSPPPEVLVRSTLAAARQAGLPFERGWEQAVAVVARRHGTARNGWMEALEETREGWQAAYDRKPPTRLEWALTVIAEDQPRRQQTRRTQPPARG